MFGARGKTLHLIKTLQQRRHLCNATQPNNTHNQHIVSENNIAKVRELEGYKDLDKLDFMKAAKILFSDPPKKKKFGLDFHLVQLFFALMPSVAVYLVAQYSRHEMRKMDAELELKKKAEEVKKAKEMEAEAKAAEEKEKARSDPELSKVKERLEALEETIKEIVVETKKLPSDEKNKSEDPMKQKAGANNRLNESHDAKTNHSTASAGSGQSEHQDSEKKGTHQDNKK